ncbi:hypothetical protein ABZ865_08125 [Streptomyces sp. NPDC047085]|uniref:hypothetical protein n=1 Tax=Streptomyces sp. NPDC047085 TaxID=3155140 RepID=UPI0033CE3058
MDDSNAPQTASDDPVEAKWQLVLEMDENLIDKPLVEAAYAAPAPKTVPAGQPRIAAIQPMHPLSLVRRPTLGLPPRR